ncbi:hypothetical protein HaLaN_20651 [Haematococcus lacustris]|uniref:Uncharacterized protein n=1 Tax=Haematococcus lacustris TaxID=44745 RepID=A0A699ZKC0_HAELA|nr:hypothetical protein HaLaN_20651 [Haematococcus lacustris]
MVMLVVACLEAGGACRFNNRDRSQVYTYPHAPLLAIKLVETLVVQLRAPIVVLRSVMSTLYFMHIFLHILPAPSPLEVCVNFLLAPAMVTAAGLVMDARRRHLFLAAKVGCPAGKK